MKTRVYETTRIFYFLSVHDENIVPSFSSMITMLSFCFHPWRKYRVFLFVPDENIVSFFSSTIKILSISFHAWRRYPVVRFDGETNIPIFFSSVTKTSFFFLSVIKISSLFYVHDRRITFFLSSVTQTSSLSFRLW